MHAIVLKDERIIAINHNPDWSGETHITYWIDPIDRKGEFTTWVIPHAHALADLANGFIASASQQAIDGSVVPFRVIARTISVLAQYIERERIREIVNSI